MANKETDEDIEIQEERGEKEIDLLQLAKDIWARKKTVGLWCLIGAVIGVIVAFSIPKEYTTNVKLAPEISDKMKTGSGLNTLAAMAGISTPGGSTDAVYPNLYPDILQSVPFCVSLFDVPVTDKDGERVMTVREFLENDTKSPWWSAILALPGKIIGAILPSDDDDDNKTGGTDTFRLTKDENDLVEALNNRISASVDQKTMVVDISVNMQDPMVSAILADTIVNRLGEYVTAYRTNKARKDMEYIEHLNNEAKAGYYAAQQKYADYLDSHQGIVMYSAKTMRDRLENEATLAFNMYNQTSQQLQVAKAKVQEETPVYATIKPPTVPLRASSPRKLLIIIGFTFLAFVASCAWVLFVDPILKRGKNTETPVAENPA